jgi:hypothetical protein
MLRWMVARRFGQADRGESGPHRHLQPPERWAENVSEDIASEVMLRVYRAVGELPSSLEGFIDQHVGPDRQLTLRLA